MKTVTALFDDYQDAARAVRALEAAGFGSDQVSLVVSTLANTVDTDTDDDTMTAEGTGAGAGIGAAVGGAGGLLAGLGALAIPGLGPVVAAGWLISVAVGAVAGAAVGGATGGLVGSMTHSGVHEHDAEIYAEGIRRGGTVVSARVEEADAGRVDDIFAQANRVDIADRRRLYESEGWERFDPEAQPFTEEPLRGGPLIGNFRGPY